MAKYQINDAAPCGLNEGRDINDFISFTDSLDANSKESAENILVFANGSCSSANPEKRTITKTFKNSPSVYTGDRSYSLLSRSYNSSIKGWEKRRAESHNTIESAPCSCQCFKENVNITEYPSQADDSHRISRSSNSSSLSDIDKEILITSYRKKQPTLKYTNPECPKIIKPSTQKDLNEPAPCSCDAPPKIYVMNKKKFDRNLRQISEKRNNVDENIKYNKKKRKVSKRKLACKIEQAKKFFVSLVPDQHKKLVKEALDTLIENPKITPKVCPEFKYNPNMKKIQICPYTCTQNHRRY